jgi:hypothetical protein
VFGPRGSTVMWQSGVGEIFRLRSEMQILILLSKIFHVYGMKVHRICVFIVPSIDTVLLTNRSIEGLSSETEAKGAANSVLRASYDSDVTVYI